MPYTVIVTFFNEERALKELVQELESCIGAIKSTELVLVDDGSTDKSLQVANSLKGKYGNIKILRNKTNLGRGFSLKRGVEAAKGDVIGIIDADLQYYPEDLKKMLRIVESGKADLVCGCRTAKRNSAARRALSAGYNIFCRSLLSVPVHDSNSGIKAGKKEVFQSVPLCGGAYRLIAARAAKKYRLAETAVRHRKRAHGQSRIPTPKIFIETLGELLKAAGGK